MPEPNDRQELETVIRGVAAAGKALKLYPSTSPIPMESVATAAAALDSFLSSRPVLALAVVREGFAWYGEQIGGALPGVSDLADALRDHGVAEIDFLPGCSAEELIGFLTVIMLDADAVRSEGGVSAVLATNGVERIRATDVQLTVLEEVVPDEDQDIDEFLRQLATDPEKLAAWMAAASAGDPAAFGEGLSELAAAAGPEGRERLLETLAAAFMRQGPDSKDALLGLAFQPGTVRDLADGMFSRLQDGAIASALTEGLFGKNMLSLSNALTGLPIEQRIEQVRAEVQAMLAGGGHATKELAFLDHMVEVRRRVEPETALVDTDSLYRSVARASAMPEEEIELLRAQTAGAKLSAARGGVNTLLALLDQQQDFELYCKGVDGLAAMVPRLVEAGDLEVALRVLEELSLREARADQPWPELTGRLRLALAAASSSRSMSALMHAVIEDPQRLETAREIARVAGDAAGPAIAEEAVSLKADGIAAAEGILGRRLIDLLANHAPRAQWFQLGPIVERLSREPDARAWQAIEAAARRPDEQSRREIAAALSSASQPAAVQTLAGLARDASTEVAVVAVRGLGRSPVPGAAAALSARLDELDVDGKDFALAREIIGALARVPDPGADAALARVAGRKALIKRGHFAEIQDLAAQAAAVRAREAGR